MRVITFNEGVLSARLIQNGIAARVVDESKSGLSGMVSKVYSNLKGKRWDIVHTHGFKENFIGGLAGRAYGAKYIVRTHHGKGMVGNSGINSWIEWLNAYLLTNRIISVSNDLTKFLRTNHYPDRKIRTVHNGIDPDSVVTTKTREAMKREVGLDEGVTVIGTIGRVEPIKGHRYFVEAAKLLLEKRQGIHFMVVGAGSSLAELEEYAKRLSVHDHVTFTGFRENPADLLNMFDIFVLPSVHEGIPITLLEAMILKKPIVASNVGGIPEVIKHSYSGLLTSPGDATAICSAFLQILNDERLRFQMAENAHKEVRRAFSLQESVARTIDVYCGTT